MKNKTLINIQMKLIENSEEKHTEFFINTKVRRNTLYSPNMNKILKLKNKKIHMKYIKWQKESNMSYNDIIRTLKK